MTLTLFVELVVNNAAKCIAVCVDEPDNSDTDQASKNELAQVFTIRCLRCSDQAIDTHHEATQLEQELTAARQSCCAQIRIHNVNPNQQRPGIQGSRTLAPIIVGQHLHPRPSIEPLCLRNDAEQKDARRS